MVRKKPSRDCFYSEEYRSEYLGDDVPLQPVATQRVLSLCSRLEQRLPGEALADLNVIVSSPLDCTSAFRRLARLVHPDRPGGSTEAMTDLNLLLAAVRVR